MKNCKKLLLLVLALCLALAAVGCAPAEEAAPEVNVPVQDIADELLAMEDQFASMMAWTTPCWKRLPSTTR